jgi:serine protease
MKWAWSIPAALVLAAGATASYAQEPKVFTGNLRQRAAEYVPDRLIVGFKDSVTDAEASQIVSGAKPGASVRALGLRRAFHVLSVPKGQVFETMSALKSDPRVRYAHPDWIVHALDIPPNDPFYPVQWNFQSPNPAAGSIHVEGAWAVNPGGDPSVVVAVVDTGIAYENFGSFCQAPDLAGTHFVAGWDFVNNDAHANDDESHGTHVAGTIAQATHNAFGVAGIAYNVSLMPVKVLNAQGSGTITQIANGIRFAADNGAHVINMSFGTSALPSQLVALQDAVQYAASRGVLMVAAAGNSAGATPMYPAAYPEVISVGATLYNKALASYSNRGANLCGPGGTSTNEDLNGDGYPDMILQNTLDPNTHATCNAFGMWFFAGTSMASPHVAAIAALVKSEQPSLTSAEIRQLLYDTADNTVTPDCGFGLVDAKRALEAAAVGDHPPTASIFSPAAGSMLAGSVTVQIAAADALTPVGNLTVEWSRNGGSWQAASYNAVSGYYEAAWDTTAETEDSQVTLRAHAVDNASQTTESAPVTVSVNNSNQPPAAAFSYSCTSNVCSFNASASSDADGTTLAYAWSFGDGLTGVGKTTSHTFTAVGTYVVTLTVTDELGATGTRSENVTVASVNNTSHVSDLDGLGRRLFLGFWEARITIRIADTLNRPVGSARVSGLFNDGTSLFQCTTNASGSCTVSGYQLNLSCLTFTVTGVTHATFKYQPALNSDPDGDSNGTQITVCRP